MGHESNSFIPIILIEGLVIFVLALIFGIYMSIIGYKEKVKKLSKYLYKK